jgi:hypothetical protein
MPSLFPGFRPATLDTRPNGGARAASGLRLLLLVHLLSLPFEPANGMTRKIRVLLTLSPFPICDARNFRKSLNFRFFVFFLAEILY